MNYLYEIHPSHSDDIPFYVVASSVWAAIRIVQEEAAQNYNDELVQPHEPAKPEDIQINSLRSLSAVPGRVLVAPGVSVLAPTTSREVPRRKRR